MIRRFGRPGLIGLAARTAVVAGTATAVSGGMARSQQRKAQQSYEAEQYEASQQAMAAPQPPAEAAPANDLIGQIQQLASLKAAGVLTEAEFEAAKAKLLA